VKAKILNLEEALQMYELISKFLPTEPTTQIEVIQNIVNSTRYFKCLELLTGENMETLAGSEQNERLSVLLNGFQENHLFELPRLKVLYG
jgi:hypothetical protein